MEALTDREKRIFLAAMGREERICKKTDEECRNRGEPYEDSLVRVCKEIVRKVKGVLWQTAQPGRKVGKWQMMVDRRGFIDWFCSSCGGSGRGDYHFCPWCSAKMEGQDGKALPG